MRKRRTVFLHSLFALGASWGVTLYFNRSDEESVALMASCLLLICLFVLIPVALRHIRSDRHIRGGFCFFMMLLPLIAAVSHPGFSFPLAPVMTSSEAAAPAGYYRWGINLLINGSVFFLCGLIFSRINSEKPVTWRRTAFTTFIMAAFYLLSYYATVQILEKGWFLL